MFGIGGFELFLIVLFAFLLFGPEKIPVFLKTLRKAVTKFREAEQEVTAALKQEVVDPETGETAADVLDSLTGKSTASASKRSASSESFAERKARYEREKAEREKAAEEKAEREKAAAAETETEDAPEDPAAESAESVAPAKAAESTIAGVSIDELYSMKPVEAADVARAFTADDATDEATIAEATETVEAADDQDASTLVEVVADAGKEA